MEPLSKILIPIDFSEDSERAIELALRVATRGHTTIELLHIVEKQVYAPDLSLTEPVVPIVEQVQERALGALERLAKRTIPGDMARSLRVEIGHASKTIVEIADEEGADLIVMGTLGLTGVRHLLVGSTTEKVIRHADCPVLTVRHKAPK